MEGTPPKPPVAPAAPMPQASPLPKNEGAKNKRLVLGCVSALGCGLLLFVAILFVFIATSSDAENPIFGLFGISGSEVVNVVILITNLIFGVLTFGVFIATVVLAFRFATTKKIDKDNRKKAALGTFIATALMIFLVFLWIFAYLYLASKGTITQKNLIVTDPAQTLDLSAPVTIKFDASKIAVARRYKVLNYEWDFGDGTIRTGGPLQTHTYQDKGKNNGRFDVNAKINVLETGTGKETSQSFTKIITITNERAEIVIDARPKTGEAPLEVTFDASATADPDGEIQNFEWDFDGNRDYGDGQGAVIKHTFTQIGTYTVGLRVTESDGSQDTDSVDVEALPSKNPVAVITVENLSEEKLQAGTEYTFSAADSQAKEGSIARYRWNFGDSTPDKTTRKISHTFTEAGTFVVTLSVVDSAGREGIQTQEFEVVNPPGAPNAAIETDPKPIMGTVTGNVPLQISFDASKSSDVDNNIVEYGWDFDGDAKPDASDIQTTHTFEDVGVFHVTLVVRDSTGKEGRSSVDVDATSPGLLAKIKADPVSGEIPLTVNFDASGSSYAGHAISSYRWKFGDSSDEQLGTAKISHQYIQVGIFQAEMTVVGDDGKTAKARVQINVLPVPLHACFDATPDSGQAPLEVEFNPQCSTGTIANYHWDFGGKGESRDRRPKFTFDSAGDYVVQLRVTDNQNTVSNFEKTIRISAP